MTCLFIQEICHVTDLLKGGREAMRDGKDTGVLRTLASHRMACPHPMATLHFCDQGLRTSSLPMPHTGLLLPKFPAGCPGSLWPLAVLFPFWAEYKMLLLLAMNCPRDVSSSEVFLEHSTLFLRTFRINVLSLGRWRAAKTKPGLSVFPLLTGPWSVTSWG